MHTHRTEPDKQTEAVYNKPKTKYPTSLAYAILHILAKILPNTNAHKVLTTTINNNFQEITRK